MKKSTLLMVLSLVLALTVGLGTTLAYLTDTDADVNVMTLGNVKIEQHEYERVPDGNGGYEKIDTARGESYELQEFTQGKPLYPAVGEVTGWDPTKVYNAQFGENHMLGAMDVLDGLENVQDKFVYVENTGKSDAYIRTIIAYEMGSLSEERFDEIVAVSTNSFWKNNNIGVTNINGTNYFVCEYVYDGNMYPEGAPMIENENGRHPDGIVHPGDWTYNNLAQIYLKPEATNEDVEAIDGNKNGTYDILVVSQAVQAAGFEDAETALNEAFGKITADNHPWLGVAPNDAPTKLNVVDNADSVLESLQNGKDVYGEEGTDDELIIESDGPISLDADGAKIVLNGTGRDTHEFAYFGLVPPAGEDVELSNLKVTGSGFVEVGHHGQGGGDYTVTNLEIENLKATLDINEGGNYIAAAFSHYGNATLNDCVMTGTTSVAEDAKPYDAAFVNGTKTTIKGGEYGKVYLAAQAHVTIYDAEVGEIDSCAITTRNLGKLTIGAGTHVGTINLTPAGTYTPALVIEDGAVVDTIIYKGVSYTQTEWANR